MPPPTQVAQTMRVQRAMGVLDNTDLPMTRLALRAGVHSLRRFNALFVQFIGARRISCAGRSCSANSRYARTYCGHNEEATQKISSGRKLVQAGFGPFATSPSHAKIHRRPKCYCAAKAATIWISPGLKAIPLKCLG